MRSHSCLTWGYGLGAALCILANCWEWPIILLSHWETKDTPLISGLELRCQKYDTFQNSQLLIEKYMLETHSDIFPLSGMSRMDWSRRLSRTSSDGPRRMHRSCLGPRPTPACSGRRSGAVSGEEDGLGNMADQKRHDTVPSSCILRTRCTVLCI